MEPLREFWARVRDGWWRVSHRRELDDEMSFHLAMAEERNRRAGMAEVEARRQARLQFGSVDRFAEESRHERGLPWLEDLVQDVRYAGRTLLRAPVFTVVAIGSLALGVGANAAIFSVLDALLLRPVAYADPERLVHVAVRGRGEERGGSLSVADFYALRETTRSFGAVGAYFRPGPGFAWSGPKGAEQVSGTLITAGVLEALAARLALGRTIAPEEDAPGWRRVVLVSYEFWRDRLGGTPGAIGQTLVLEGAPHTVIGVLSPGFVMPGMPRDDVWPVLQLDAPEYRSPFWLQVVGRLAPNATLASARSELAVLGRSVKAQYPESEPHWDYDANALEEVLVREARTTLWVLAGAVLLVLCIAGANVANLQLTRAVVRRSELAVRGALGAGRGRIARQLVTESLVIAMLGGVAGVALAFALVAGARALPAPELMRADLALGGRGLLVAFALSLLAGVLIGLAPALRVPRSPGEWIRAGGRGGEARERSRLRNAFVVAECALALTLLIGAGLLVNSLLRLQRVDAGAAADGVLVVRLNVPPARYPEEEQAAAFFEQLEDRVAALPGVRGTAVAMAVPPHRLVMRNPFTVQGKVFGPQERAPIAEELLITPGYFAVLDIPLLRGRTFSAADRADAPAVAIINRTLAEQHFPGVDPIGRWLQTGNPSPDAPRLEIVGMVADVKYQGLDVAPEPTIYVPVAQNAWWRTMYLVVRGDGDPLAFVPAVRGELSALDPEIPLQEIRSMPQLLAESVAAPRARTGLLSAFAVLALVLSAAGIYGVMSYSVTRRRREAGIRLALGAKRYEILRLIVGEGVRLAGVGILLGLAGALLLTRVLRSLLFGVGTLDVPTFVGAAAVLTLAAVAGSAIPALRAARTDPAHALRAE